MCWSEKAKNALKRENIANMLQYLNVVKSMQHNLKYLKEERGAIFVLTALLLPIMFGCLGIAYDVGNIYIHKARLQNVADAAALAGGRAYLASQTDAVDGTMDYRSKEIAGCEYKGGRTAMTVKYEYGSDTTIDRGNTTKHPDADLAADKYIYKNLANLGNTVYADKYSHFALNYGSADSKIFYRIGLYETVPLRFLPVITDKYSETVRAGAIALVEPGEPGDESGGGGSTTTVIHPSIFDNLFTYSEYFDSGLATTNNTINGTFIGNMVFTYGNSSGSDNASYYMDAIIAQVAQNGYVDHLFTDSSTDLSDIKTNGNSSGWSKVNDPIINTYFNTLAYEAAFRSKLNQEHVDVRSQNALTDSNINDYNSSLYVVDVKMDGNQVYEESQSNKKFLYVNNGTECYYAYDEENNDYAYVTGAEHTEDNRIQYLYLRDSGGKYYAPCVIKDGRKYLLDNNNSLTDCYYEDWQVKGSGTYYEFKADFQNSHQPQNGFKKRVISNIFHVSSEFQENIHNTTISIQNPITVGNQDEPIYIIIEDNINEGSSSVRLNIKNNYNGRPIVVVYFGTKNILLENNSSNINLTVYAPYGTFGITKDQEQINFTGTFHGSVIAKNVAIQAGGGGTWIQENFLENDEDVKKVTQQIENNIKNAEKVSDSIKSEIYQTYANTLGVEKESMDDPYWYSKQSYENKQKLYQAWKELVVKYPEYANQLWPWNEHFNIETGGGGSVGTPDNLRLINFRTEYRENADPDAAVDPFIYVTLGNPLAY